MSDTQKSSQERAVKWIYSAQEAIDKCNELERENAEPRNLLRIADDLIDEYAEVVEHCDNVDEMREQIKAALAAERGER